MKRTLILATALLCLAACNKKTDTASDTASSEAAEVRAERLTSTPSTTAPDGTPNSDIPPAPAK